MEFTPEIVRLWTIPASAVLEHLNPRLYPWTVLLDSTQEQQIEAYRRVEELNNRDLLARIAILGGPRYPSGERLFQRLITMTEQEIIQARGEARGQARGRALGERTLLLRQLRARFGDDLPQTVVDRVDAADTATLERWAVRVLSAKTLDEALD